MFNKLFIPASASAAPPPPSPLPLFNHEFVNFVITPEFTLPSNTTGYKKILAIDFKTGDHFVGLMEKHIVTTGRCTLGGEIVVHSKLSDTESSFRIFTGEAAATSSFQDPTSTKTLTMEDIFKMLLLERNSKSHETLKLFASVYGIEAGFAPLDNEVCMIYKTASRAHRLRLVDIIASLIQGIKTAAEKFLNRTFEDVYLIVDPQALLQQALERAAMKAGFKRSNIHIVTNSEALLFPETPSEPVTSKLVPGSATRSATPPPSPPTYVIDDSDSDEAEKKVEEEKKVVPESAIRSSPVKSAEIVQPHAPVAAESSTTVKKELPATPSEIVLVYESKDTTESKVIDKSKNGMVFKFKSEMRKNSKQPCMFFLLKARAEGKETNLCLLKFDAVFSRERFRKNFIQGTVFSEHRCIDISVKLELPLIHVTISNICCEIEYTVDTATLPAFPKHFQEKWIGKARNIDDFIRENKYTLPTCRKEFKTGYKELQYDETEEPVSVQKAVLELNVVEEAEEDEFIPDKQPKSNNKKRDRPSRAAKAEAKKRLRTH